jgi:hypothetical protein
MLASIGQRYSERVSQLKEFLAANPSESIPELRYMTEKEWLWLAGEKTPDTQEGYQRAMSLARLTVEATLAHEILHPALKQYASDHNGEFPRDPSDLKPYFKTPVDDAILQRWHILPGRKLINLSATIQNQDWLITQKAPVNRAIDQRIVVGLKQTDVYADAPPKYWETAP